MARSLQATKKAKAAYSRRYRRENASKVREYNRKTVKQRANRNKARAMMVKKYGKRRLRGKDVHHKNSNPNSNHSKNLAIVKAHHEGGVRGNKNARGKHKMRKRK